MSEEKKIIDFGRARDRLLERRGMLGEGKEQATPTMLELGRQVLLSKNAISRAIFAANHPVENAALGNLNSRVAAVNHGEEGVDTELREEEILALEMLTGLKRGQFMDVYRGRKNQSAIVSRSKMRQQEEELGVVTPEAERVDLNETKSKLEKKRIWQRQWLTENVLNSLVNRLQRLLPDQPMMSSEDEARVVENCLKLLTALHTPRASAENELIKMLEELVEDDSKIEKIFQDVRLSGAMERKAFIRVVGNVIDDSLYTLRQQILREKSGAQVEK